MKNLYILLIALFCLLNVDAQNLLVSYKIKDISVMTVDKEKNILLGGLSGSSLDLDFGPGVNELTCPYGETYQFIASYDSLLNVKWTKSFYGGISGSPAKILTDDNGNVYVSGFAYDKTVFDASTNAMYSAPYAGSYGSFLAKYNKNGEFQWVKNIDGELIGLSKNSLYIDGHVAIRKYDLNGNEMWKTNVNGHHHIVYDQKSLFYFIGDIVGDPNHESQPLAISVIDTTGNLQSTLNLTSGTGSYFNLYDAKFFYINDKLLITAPYWGNIDLDPGVNNHFINNSSTYAHYEHGNYIRQEALFKNFIAAYDIKGNFIFAKDYHDNIAFPYLIKTDNQGNIYTVSSSSDSLNLSYVDKVETKLTAKGMVSCLTKYDASFNFISTVKLTEMDIIQAYNFNTKIKALNLGEDYTVMMGDYYNLYLKQNISIYPNNPENYIAIYKNFEILSSNTSNFENSSMFIYPNPAINHFTIEIPQTGKPANLTIYNTKGSKVLWRQIHDAKTTIDISNFTSDVYFVKLQTGSSIQVKKIIKK